MIAFAAMLAMPAQASPALHSLLVGTTRFATGSGVAAPRGVNEDLRRMRAVCGAYGETAPSVLSNQAAGLEGIQEGLDRIAKEAKSGDVCLFYFSGLGSGKASGAPTLVTADGTATADAGDLPMAALATWAKSVEAAGARPVLIIDACWPTKEDVMKSVQKDFHPYDTTPRNLVRKGEVKGPGYTGAGVMLAAGGPGGHAYDWQITDEAWCGAFTDLVGQSVVGAGLRSERLSPSTIYTALARTAKEYAEAGYMPDFRPSMAGDGAEPLLGRAPALASRGGVVEVEQKRMAKYRVALNVDQPGAKPEEKSRIYQAARVALVAKLAKDGDEVGFCTPGARPDAILKVRQGEEGIAFELPADDTRPKRVPAVYTAEAIDDMMPWLQRQALLARLFRLVDVNTPTATGTITTTLPQNPQAMSNLSAQATPPVSGTVFVMDRGEALNVVHLFTPHFSAINASGTPNKPVQIGGPKWSFSDRTGRHEWRIVAVENAPGFSLPALPNKSVDFELALVPYLRNLLGALEKGKVRWTGSVIPFNVEPKS